MSASGASTPLTPTPVSKLMERGLKSFAESKECPQAIKPHLLKAAPIVSTVVQKIEDLLPLIEKAVKKLQEIWEKLRPYKPELLFPAVVGLIMCFFGGTYLTLIAACEAYYMCGYESTKQCILTIWNDLEKVWEASRKDDARDDDGNGVPDVQEISGKQLMQRKTLLFLRTVDPNRLTLAVQGISAGFMAVVATLKLEFAKAVTLGNAIGATIEKPAKEHALPLFEKAFPVEYKKWAWPIMSYTIRSFSISIAWFIQRVISSFHSAIRGGLMFSRNIMVYLTEMNIYKINHEESYLDEIVGYGLALIGVWFQLSLRFAVPFPLNVLLFPASFAEWFLMWMVNVKK